MEHRLERVQSCPQMSSPYRATDEIDRLLRRGHEVVIEGGEYVAHLVLTTLPGERFYLPYTDSKPYVYPPAQPTLQEALDTLDSACRAALDAMPPKREETRREGPPLTLRDLNRRLRNEQSLAPVEQPRRHLSPFARRSDAPPSSAPEKTE